MNFSLKSEHIKCLASIILFFFGLGVAIHDACHHLYEIGGYKEILSPQGIYIGFLIMVIGYFLGIWKDLQTFEEKMVRRGNGKT